MKNKQKTKIVRYVVGMLILFVCALEKVDSTWASTTSLPPQKTQATPPSAQAPEMSEFPDIQEIIASGVLRVSVCKDERPPFFFTDKDGNFRGLDITMAQEIAKALGVAVEFIRTAPNFDEVVKQVAKGESHIAISKLSFTEKRMKKVYYVPPYITLRVSLLVNRTFLDKMPGLSIKEIFKKNKLTVAAVKGSSQVAAISLLFPNADVMVAESAEEANKLVADGKCFARLSDDNELRKLLLIQPEFNLTCAIVALKEMEDNIHIVTGLHYGNLAIVLETLLRNRPDLRFTLDAVFKKYEQDIKDYYKQQTHK